MTEGCGCHNQGVQEEQKAWPAWWSETGMGMVVRSENPTDLALVSDTQRLCIFYEGVNASDMVEWRLHRKIQYSGEEFSEGVILLADPLLLTAFGLSDLVTPCGRRLAERYGADAAFQGAFMRKGDYAIFPGPGTGLEGDANFSLFLTESIKAAVQTLYDFVHQDHAPQPIVCECLST